MGLATSEISSWIKEYTNEMYHYAFLKVNDKENAEDIVQNTFLAAVEAYPRFRHESSPKTWLFAILKNKVADHLRKRYKNSSATQTVDPLDICFDKNGAWEPCHRPGEWKVNEAELLDNPEFNLALKTCFEHLPAKWSSAVQLKFFFEHNSSEICDKLNITLSNFWQMIHRAKTVLRLCLETNWFKDGVIK